MEDAATCVFYRLEGDTNVPVPPISTWLLTIRPASPTAPPVRSAPLLNPTTSKFSLTVLLLFSHDQCFPPEGKQLYSHMLSSFEMYCRYLENWFGLWFWRMWEPKPRVKYSCWHQILCFLLYLFVVPIVSLRDRWVYPFLVEVWHGGWLWGWIRRTCWLPWVPCYSDLGFKKVLYQKKSTLIVVSFWVVF